MLIGCYVALLKVNSSEGKTTEEETRRKKRRQSHDDISTITFESGDQTLTFQKGEDSDAGRSGGLSGGCLSKVEQRSILSGIDQKRTRTLTDCGGRGRIRSWTIRSNVIEVCQTDGSTEKITVVVIKTVPPAITYICLNDDTSTVYTTGYGSWKMHFPGGLYNYAESEDYPTITSIHDQQDCGEKESAITIR